MRNLRNVDYHVTDRCNLNCVSCGHFCPLVPHSVQHKSLSQVSSDLTLLYNVSEEGSRIDQLTITGGECTLNPNLKNILLIATALFPNKVKIWTNGTNHEVLWSLEPLVYDFNLTICMTEYDRVDPFIIQECKRIFGSHFYYVDRRDHDGNNKVKFFRTFFDHTVDTPLDNILHCDARFECNQLVDGKLYPCQYAAYFKYFDEHFKGQHELKLGPGHCINLKAITDFDDVIRFMDTCTFKLCEHCIDCIPEKKQYQDWCTSKKELSEWYV